MPAIPIIALAATAVSAGLAAKSSVQAANTSKATAAYNARVDEEQAKQVEINSRENMQKQASANEIYLSRQKSAIAANGLLAAGSPLDLLAESASELQSNLGDMGQEESVERSRLFSSAGAGLMEGAAQASAYQMQGATSLLSGVGSIGSMGMQAYQAGYF